MEWFDDVVRSWLWGHGMELPLVLLSYEWFWMQILKHLMQCSCLITIHSEKQDKLFLKLFVPCFGWSSRNKSKKCFLMKKQMEPLGIHPSNYLKVRNKRQCMFMYCLRIFCTVRKVLTIGFLREKVLALWWSLLLGW